MQTCEDKTRLSETLMKSNFNEGGNYIY